jgi:uncharacterized protein YdaU (DUF1376 family)
VQVKPFFYGGILKHYPHHIGDFDKATRHLSRIERSVYRDLIDLYYDTERQLPLEIEWICRRIIAKTNEESTAVEQTLNEFFTKTPTGWYHARCEEEIERYRSNNSQKALAGKASAAAKALKTQQAINTRSTYVEQASSGAPTNQEPRTKNQYLIPLPPTGGSPIDHSGQPDQKQQSPRKVHEKHFPDCPHQRLLELWAKHLPHLSQPRVWEGSRKAAMRSRWQQAAKPSAYSPKGYASEPEGIAWWDSFFSYIAKDTTLPHGFESKGRTWRPDLEWVCNAANFQKIIDGKYES